MNQCLDLWQEGTDEDEAFNAAITTADGNVVVAGYTAGSWDITNDGWFDVAAAKLNVDDGDVIWRYQVRQAQHLLRLRRNSLEPRRLGRMCTAPHPPSSASDVSRR